MKTLLNKICAVIMILGGYLCMKVDNDGTVFIMMLAFGVPLFFAKENMFTF